MNYQINFRLLNQTTNFFEKKYMDLTRPVDAGMWVFHKNRWKEDQNLDLEFVKTNKYWRSINAETIVDMTVDGYPRQGNTSLREAILESFSNISMSTPMAHRIVLLEQAIMQNKVVIVPVREPYATISSAVNQIRINKKRLEYKEKYYQKKHLDTLIFESINFYNRYAKYVLKNNKKKNIIKFEDIIQLHNDRIEKRAKHNKLLNYFSKMYNIKIHESNNISKIDSTKSNEVLSRLKNKKFKKKMKKANKLYNKLYDLSLELK